MMRQLYTDEPDFPFPRVRVLEDFTIERISKHERSEYTDEDRVDLNGVITDTVADDM